jgi:KUP system potassium uptake protein
VHKGSAALALGALGVVFGDIGTSPLYALKECVSVEHGVPPTPANVLGLLSLIFWALTLVVSIKYVTFIMRADNDGEGGILALLALVPTRLRDGGRWGIGALAAAVLFGAALLYGDGIITPAISVLSAVEGLKVASAAFASYTMPIAAVILLSLFAVQQFGTAAVGRAFGPIMLVWFVFIAGLGIGRIIAMPHVLAAIEPDYAVSFLAEDWLSGLGILGAVFLCVTGAEAMYADMGHLGRRSIRVAWTVIVLPALLLNYAGQTAAFLEGATTNRNPFFMIVPSWALYPAVALSTVATVIASQAIITGSFSLTRQAMQLGWMPGMNIRQTSSLEYGQIYIPFVNWAMMIGTLLLTVAFASSDRLAGAYGAAVSTTMLMTTAILYRIMKVSWRWPTAAAVAVFSVFLAIDIVFFGANLLKVVEGGWIPLLIGALILTIMVTWRTGLDAMRRCQQRNIETVAQFVRKLRDGRVPRIAGKAIFLTRLRGAIPPLIADHVRQFGSLYEEAIALSVRFVNRPRVDPDDRVRVDELGEGFWQMTVHFGFFETPDVAKGLHRKKSDCPVNLDNAIYFNEHDYPVRRKQKPRLPGWQRRLFAFLYRNSIHPADRFNIPADNFVQITRQVDI